MPTHPSHHDHDDGTVGTTRTRLPEGGSTATRRPSRSSRGLVPVVGVIVLLIAALAFATRGHGGGSSGSAGGAGAGGTGTSGGDTRTAPTAPTGTHPVNGTTAGIPTGYPRTPQGAQSAAANYAVALGGSGMFTPQSRHAIVTTIYAPDIIAAQQARLDSAYTDATFLKHIGLTANGTAPAGMTLVSRTNPVGAKIDSLSGDTAKVEVWYSSLFGLAGNGSTNPVSESWYTDTFQLSWADSDWKMTSLSQADGPTPVGRDQAASSAQAMTNAVSGFGGFTYAR